MPRRPFLLHLILPFAALIVVVVVVCGVLIWWAGQRNVRLQQVRDLNRLCMLVRGTLRPDSHSISEQEARRIKDLADVLETRITLIDGGGAVLLDTHRDPDAMENHNARPEVAEARALGVGSSVRRSDTIDENAVYVAELLDRNQPGGMVVRLSYPQHVWAHLGVPVWAIVLAGTAIAALLMLLLAMVLQRRWIGPVRDIASASDRMAAGQWQTRVEPAGDDEVRALGNRFNVMAAQAQKQLDDLRHQRADLQTLVDSLPDPILLSDSLQRIVVINAPAARLLQLKANQALGRKLVEVINEEAILRVIEQVGGNSTSVTREVRLQRAGQHLIYRAVATRSTAGGMLLVLQDISAMATAVQMKTDFVANASHELRTPLAAIKMAFETLRDVYQEDPEQSSRCITIVDGHLKRLEEMLTDLLDLSRVESADLRAQIAPVKVEELVSHLRATMGSLARQKNVELRFNLDELGADAEFDSDQRLLHLVLKNLVENSIKFTPAGGSVTVQLRRQSEDDQLQMVLQIIDTGIGIPPEHQQRVFERFYQVDPARSGSAGRGTGLGLAIVKHAIHALGGRVELSSTVGKGTTVTCILPNVEPSGEVRSGTEELRA